MAVTHLHPSGVALVRGERVDVVTRGDYVSAGDEIVVVADEGYRRVVRRVDPDEAAGADPGKV